MKKLAVTLCLAIIFAVPVFGQDACSQSTKLSNPSKTITSNGTGDLSGSGNTKIHYEMWTNGGAQGSNKLIWYGADKGGGAAFRAEWANPNDYLGRIGYYWGDGGKYTTYKNIYVDFNYTRSGRSTAGDYSYIGIYGWTKSPLVEYYVVEDWFGNQWQNDNTPITTNTTSGTVQGTFTVDGSVYQVVKNTRNNEPSIQGNATFTQYFSIRQTQRKCGTISLTEHFKQWEKMGLTMGNMYEAKFLAEAGGGTGWLELSYLKFSQEDQPRGSGSTPSSSSKASSSSVASSSSKASSSSTASSSSKPSSSSAAVSSSSRASSSSVASSSSRASSSSVASSSSRANSSSSVAGSSSSNAVPESSSSSVEDNCIHTDCQHSLSSSSGGEDPDPILKNRVPITYFSIQPQSDKSLRIEISSPAVVEIFDLKGNKVERFNVSNTQQTVKLSSPSGVYFAKVHGMKSIRFVLK